MALPIGRKKENDVIQAQSLGTTTLAGVGAAVTGVSGAVISLLPEISKVDVPLALQAAGLAVVGLAIIAWGIATAGDALARAYTTAHVDHDGNPLMATVLRDISFGVTGIQNNGSDAKKPALAAAVQRLAEAHENATFGVAGIQNDGSDAKKPALAEALKTVGARTSAGAGRQLIQAPRGLTHNDGTQEHEVVGLLFSPQTGAVQQLYLDAACQPRLTEALEITF